MTGELARSANVACKSPPRQDGRLISCGPDSSLYGHAICDYPKPCRVPTTSDFSRKGSETAPVPPIFLRQGKGLKCLARDSLVGDFDTVLAITARPWHSRGARKDSMISADHLRRIAVWSADLNTQEIDVARAGIVERSFRANEFICLHGDHFDYWTGVVSGLVKVGSVSRAGKAISFTGFTAGAWFGEGSVLKHEPRRYDAVALRDSRLALMDRATFLWLFENSAAFNRFLVAQLNERVGQFIALLEYGRMLDATGRVARCIASLFNPILYPGGGRHLDITQEEVGALSGMSRQNANQCLRKLEREGLLKLDYGGLTVLDLERLNRYGE